MESFNAIDQEKKINELCDEQVAKINSKLSTLSKYANYCYELLEEISITESNYKDALSQLEKSRMEMLAKTKRGEYISYPQFFIYIKSMSRVIANMKRVMQVFEERSRRFRNVFKA